MAAVVYSVASGLVERQRKLRAEKSGRKMEERGRLKCREMPRSEVEKLRGIRRDYPVSLKKNACLSISKYNIGEKQNKRSTQSGTSLGSRLAVLGSSSPKGQCMEADFGPDGSSHKNGRE